MRDSQERQGQTREQLIQQLKAIEEVERLTRLLKGERAGGGLEDFIKRIAPTQHPPKHLRPLIDAIERARFTPARICISLPPGHAKTLTLLRGIVWWLTCTPRDTCGYFAYNNDLGCDGSVKCRSVAVEAGLTIGTPNTADQWRTPQGGGLFAGGVGTALTGRRITGLMVVDDPFKDRKMADSASYRNDVWSWFNSVVMTRLENASAIVVHTRWSTDDLVGRLMKLGGWDIINMPAIWDDMDAYGNPAKCPLGRVTGEALWPSQYSSDYLDSLRRQIGEFEFSALYQGQPRSRGARVFGPPRYYSGRIPDGCAATIGVDPAATKSTTADWSVAVSQATKGRDHNRETWIMNVVRKQTTIPDFVRTLRAFQAATWYAPAYVEAVGGFKAVPQMLKDLDPKLKVMEAPTFGDKFQRAQPLAAAWNDGRVYLPENAPWIKDFVSEFEEFTGVDDPHDDQVDATAHGFNPLVESLSSFRPRQAREDTDRW